MFAWLRNQFRMRRYTNTFERVFGFRDKRRENEVLHVVLCLGFFLVSFAFTRDCAYLLSRAPAARHGLALWLYLVCGSLILAIAIIGAACLTHMSLMTAGIISAFRNSVVSRKQSTSTAVEIPLPSTGDFARQISAQGDCLLEADLLLRAAAPRWNNVFLATFILAALGFFVSATQMIRRELPLAANDVWLAALGYFLLMPVPLSLFVVALVDTGYNRLANFIEDVRGNADANHDALVGFRGSVFARMLGKIVLPKWMTVYQRIYLPLFTGCVCLNLLGVLLMWAPGGIPLRRLLPLVLLPSVASWTSTLWYYIRITPGKKPRTLISAIQDRQW